MIEWKENPDETDFPLIDRCVICDGLCDWQPRFEIAARSDAHKLFLASERSLNYVPEYRVVCICASCIPADNAALRRMVRREYPTYAALWPSRFKEI